MLVLVVVVKTLGKRFRNFQPSARLTIASDSHKNNGIIMKSHNIDHMPQWVLLLFYTSKYNINSTKLIKNRSYHRRRITHVTTTSRSETDSWICTTSSIRRSTKFVTRRSTITARYHTHQFRSRGFPLPCDQNKHTPTNTHTHTNAPDHYK